MAGASPRRRLCVDTNVVLDLAREKEFAHAFREDFQAEGYSLFAPPAVIIELHQLSQNGATAAEQGLGLTALVSLRRWRLQPFDLDSTAEALAGQFARRLLQLRLLPAEEFNDALILGESALAEIPLLVTSDKHLLDIDESELQLAFHAADLPMVNPVHPRRLLKALR
jgi:predicted nucleic acid-binding protein